ncbi:hypothetical protein ACW0UW_07470 [[Haemophilus] ducreyi]
MKFWQKFSVLCMTTLGLSSTVLAEDYNIKYSSNYLMPAYVHFKNEDGQYSIQAKINVPLYNITFSAKGIEHNQQFHMLSYRDMRNDKMYALAEIDSTQIKYGKAKGPLAEEALTMPTFDLFTLAFQLSYYDKLPENFQTTNGKKLYPTLNVNLKKDQKQIKTKGQVYQEITYSVMTSDDKTVVVKKYEGEKFPRYISYHRDGDKYELTFDRFVK